MQVVGYVVAKSDVMSGQSANGEWMRMTIVIQTNDDNPQMVPVEFFGSRRVRGVMNVPLGQLVQVFFRIQGRERDGHWFCSLDGNMMQPLVKGQIEKDSDGKNG